MKLKHQIAAGAAVILLMAGCNQDQGLGGSKDAGVTGSKNEVQEPAKAPAVPNNPTPAQPSDQQSTVTPTNTPQNTPPASNPTTDHQ